MKVHERTIVIFVPRDAPVQMLGMHALSAWLFLLAFPDSTLLLKGQGNY